MDERIKKAQSICDRLQEVEADCASIEMYEMASHLKDQREALQRVSWSGLYRPKPADDD